MRSVAGTVSLETLLALRTNAVDVTGGTLLAGALMFVAVMKLLGLGSGIFGIARHLMLLDTCCADISRSSNSL